MATTYDIWRPDVNVKQALIWRHNNAPVLTSLANAKEAWYETNHAGFWQDWYNGVFNLTTANDFGCSVWSIILDLFYNIENTSVTNVPFGFGMFNKNFFNSNFSPIEKPSVALKTFEKIIILLLRHWQIVSKGRTVEDNSFLKTLFQPANENWDWPGMPTNWPKIVDNLNMTCSVSLNAPISANLASVIIGFDLLPRASTVNLIVTNNTGA